MSDLPYNPLLYRKASKMRAKRINRVSKTRRKRSGKPGKLGIVRLYGADMEALRRACFERDGYICQGRRLFEMPWGQTFELACRRDVTWETGEMGHIRTKRNHGDTLDNVRTLCHECHAKEHNAGGKPCPKKGT